MGPAQGSGAEPLQRVCTLQHTRWTRAASLCLRRGLAWQAGHAQAMHLYDCPIKFGTAYPYLIHRLGRNPRRGRRCSTCCGGPPSVSTFRFASAAHRACERPGYGKTPRRVPCRRKPAEGASCGLHTVGSNTIPACRLLEARLINYQDLRRDRYGLKALQSLALRERGTKWTRW